MRRLSLSPMVVFCNTDQYIFFPATPWMTAEEAQLIRDGLEGRNLPASNNMTLAIGMQVCNDPGAPDAAVALASSRTTDGLTYPVQPVSKVATTGARQLVRFGYLAKNTTASDTTVRFAWVVGSVEYERA